MNTRLRVLMVEDCEDSCLLVTEEIQKHGYQVSRLRVDSAPLMRRALADHAWDVIIADYVVPGFDALQSLNLAKELAPDLPFVVVSGNLGEEVAVAVMKAGAHDYITKGNLTRLVPAIERELREAETRRARCQAEAALEREEALSRAVLDSLTAEIAVVDARGLVLANNAAWDLRTQRARQSDRGHPAIGENYLDAFRTMNDRATGDKALAGIRGVLEGSLANFALEYSRPAAEANRWFLLNATPLVNHGGAVISHIDLTVTKHAEEALRQAQEALRKSQAGLLLAQRIGHVGSWELDIASESMDWSAETYRILDVAPDGTRPSFQRFLELVVPDDRVRVRQGLERAMKEGSSFRGDCRIACARSSVRFAHIQAQLILDSIDRPVQMLGTIQDITDGKLLEEQVRQSQKMEAVGQLAGGIAHDFNNILTVIQGYTELIGCQTGIDPQTRSYAEQIAVSAERASTLTRQLLTFSRKQHIQPRTLDVNGWVTNLASMLQRLLGEQSRLQLILQADLPQVRADSGMLEQVVVNLVVNARDAMPRGGEVTIETSLHEIGDDYCRVHAEASPGRFICLRVIDTGSGMDASTLQHMFEPFFTTKEIGRGTGLGLSTVYGIVKQHQGWITVASEVGQGSAFSVFLPVIVQAAAPALGGTSPSAPAGGGTETILLVEDEPQLRQLARSTLERHGYRVLEAGSGPDALTIWNEAPGGFDLLLTDMVMPGGMTGRELAVRLLGLQPDLSVLYTSGYSVEFVENDLLLSEGVNFLPKPYSGASLAQAVRRCLNRRATPQG